MRLSKIVKSQADAIMEAGRDKTLLLFFHNLNLAEELWAL